jgi:hypothetical protein
MKPKSTTTKISKFSKQKPKKTRKSKKSYHIRNWKTYNESLVKRGSLELWIGDDVLLTWEVASTHTRGHPFTYSDLAIETALTVRKIFHLRLRPLEGFLQSIFRILNLPQHFILLGFSELFKRMCQQRLKIRESHPTLDYETTL